MNKKTIMIIPIFCIILLVAIIILFNTNKNSHLEYTNLEVEVINEIEKEQEIPENNIHEDTQSSVDSPSQVSTVNNENKHLKISNMFPDKTQDEEYMNYVSSEEYKNKVKNQMLDDVIYSSRNIGHSPTYKFTSSDFNAVPYDEDWQIESFIKAYLAPDELNKYINDIEVFNLEETKTNFIVYKLQASGKDALIIVSMYASENTKQIVYENLNENFDNYFDIGIDLLNRLKELGAIKVELKGEINE